MGTCMSEICASDDAVVEVGGVRRTVNEIELSPRRLRSSSPDPHNGQQQASTSPLPQSSEEDPTRDLKAMIANSTERDRRDKYRDLLSPTRARNPEEALQALKNSNNNSKTPNAASTTTIGGGGGNKSPKDVATSSGEDSGDSDTESVRSVSLDVNITGNAFASTTATTAAGRHSPALRPSPVPAADDNNDLDDIGDPAAATMSPSGAAGANDKTTIIEGSLGRRGSLQPDARRRKSNTDKNDNPNRRFLPYQPPDDHEERSKKRRKQREDDAITETQADLLKQSRAVVTTTKTGGRTTKILNAADRRSPSPVLMRSPSGDTASGLAGLNSNSQQPGSNYNMADFRKQTTALYREPGGSSVRRSPHSQLYDNNSSFAGGGGGEYNPEQDLDGVEEAQDSDIPAAVLDPHFIASSDIDDSDSGSSSLSGGDNDNNNVSTVAARNGRHNADDSFPFRGRDSAETATFTKQHNKKNNSNHRGHSHNDFSVFDADHGKESILPQSAAAQRRASLAAERRASSSFARTAAADTTANNNINKSKQQESPAATTSTKANKNNNSASSLRALTVDADWRFADVPEITLQLCALRDVTLIQSQEQHERRFLCGNFLVECYHTLWLRESATTYFPMQTIFLEALEKRFLVLYEWDKQRAMVVAAERRESRAVDVVVSRKVAAQAEAASQARRDREESRFAAPRVFRPKMSALGARGMNDEYYSNEQQQQSGNGGGRDAFVAFAEQSPDQQQFSADEQQQKNNNPQQQQQQQFAWLRKTQREIERERKQKEADEEYRRTHLNKATAKELGEDEFSWRFGLMQQHRSEALRIIARFVDLGCFPLLGALAPEDRLPIVSRRAAREVSEKQHLEQIERRLAELAAAQQQGSTKLKGVITDLSMVTTMVRLTQTEEDDGRFIIIAAHARGFASIVRSFVTEHEVVIAHDRRRAVQRHTASLNVMLHETHRAAFRKLQRVGRGYLARRGLGPVWRVDRAGPQLRFLLRKAEWGRRQLVSEENCVFSHIVSYAARLGLIPEEQWPGLLPITRYPLESTETVEQLLREMIEAEEEKRWFKLDTRRLIGEAKAGVGDVSAAIAAANAAALSLRQEQEHELQRRQQLQQQQHLSVASSSARLNTPIRELSSPSSVSSKNSDNVGGGNNEVFYGNSSSRSRTSNNRLNAPITPVRDVGDAHELFHSVPARSSSPPEVLPPAYRYAGVVISVSASP